ncbi:MAG: GHKL domain-containing protein [Melioribacter sp.]|nr:GHKL domain-containing protein [Melioribacter sp.]
MFKNIKLFFTSTRFKITIWYSSLFLLLEVLLGVSVYIYLYHISHVNLDQNLRAQAGAILRVVEEKHLDLDTFEPSSEYKTEDELIWDIIYDAVVFNRRNTFIEISTGQKLIYKSANLGQYHLAFPDKKNSELIFNYNNELLSKDVIRVCQMKAKRFNVIVAYPIENIAQTLNNLTDIYIMMAPLFLIISIIGGALISAKSLSRIDALIKKTEEITAQNLSEKIPGGEYFDEYGRLVNKMNEMISRIKTSIDFMNQFSVSAAHELKTPLTILRGEIEITLKSEKTPERYIEVLKSNYEETIRLIKIVDNLFFISKSDNALIAINKQDVELTSFLNSIIQNMRLLGQEKNMDIVLDSNSKIIIELDQDLIKQALSNIIDNAFKFGDENTTILIHAEEMNNTIKISVTNTGPGIPNESLDKIFNRFYRVDVSRTRRTGGVGLGLSVVKSIITLHGGNVEVKSTPNDITTISIFLHKNQKII